jgi:hypothetical protein
LSLQTECLSQFANVLRVLVMSAFLRSLWLIRQLHLHRVTLLPSMLDYCDCAHELSIAQQYGLRSEDRLIM